MGYASFTLPRDENGHIINKFLDAFEPVRFDMSGEPKYYADMHPDGRFVIRKHTNDVGDEHITFYFGAIGETLSVLWPSRASLTYVEYDALY